MTVLALSVNVGLSADDQRLAVGLDASILAVAGQEAEYGSEPRNAMGTYRILDIKASLSLPVMGFEVTPFVTWSESANEDPFQQAPGSSAAPDVSGWGAGIGLYTTLLRQDFLALKSGIQAAFATRGGYDLGSYAYGPASSLTAAVPLILDLSWGSWGFRLSQVAVSASLSWSSAGDVGGTLTSSTRGAVTWVDSSPVSVGVFCRF